MIVLVRIFSYTPDASFSDEILLHFWGYVFLKNFSDTPRAMSSEELLLHSWW